MGIMITYHRYDNGHDSPVDNVRKNVGMRYTWECVMHSKTQ